MKEIVNGSGHVAYVYAAGITDEAAIRLFSETIFDDGDLRVASGPRPLFAGDDVIVDVPVDVAVEPGWTVSEAAQHFASGGQ